MPRVLLVLLLGAIVAALVVGDRRDVTHAAPRIPATYPPTRHVVDGPRLVFCVRGACGGPEAWAQRSLRHARALADLRARLAELRQRVRHLAVHTDAAPVATDVRSIISAVFGGYASQALAVASCESSLSTSAANGQYLGLFQMGSTERATYGDGPDAWSQARAAYRYFVASGRDWSPWECKPW